VQANGGYFTLFHRGLITRELPFDVHPDVLRLELERTGSAAAYEAALASLQVSGGSQDLDPSPEHNLLVKLLYADNATSTREFEVTFLTDLSHGGEPFDSTLVLPSSGYQWNSTTSLSPNEDDTSLVLAGGGGLAKLEVSQFAAPLRGEYPVEYVVEEAGQWELHVQDMQGLHIQGSPFMPEIVQSDVDGSSSPARGLGLVEGTAGSTFSFQVQARDTRKFER